MLELLHNASSKWQNVNLKMIFKTSNSDIKYLRIEFERCLNGGSRAHDLPRDLPRSRLNNETPSRRYRSHENVIMINLFGFAVRRPTTISGGNCSTRAPRGSTTTTPRPRRRCGIDQRTATSYRWPNYRLALCLSILFVHKHRELSLIVHRNAASRRQIVTPLNNRTFVSEKIQLPESLLEFARETA